MIKPITVGAYSISLWSYVSPMVQSSTVWKRSKLSFSSRHIDRRIFICSNGRTAIYIYAQRNWLDWFIFPLVGPDRLMRKPCDIRKLACRTVHRCERGKPYCVDLCVWYRSNTRKSRMEQIQVDFSWWLNSSPATCHGAVKSKSTLYPGETKLNPGWSVYTTILTPTCLFKRFAAFLCCPFEHAKIRHCNSSKVC